MEANENSTKERVEKIMGNDYQYAIIDTDGKVLVSVFEEAQKAGATLSSILNISDYLISILGDKVRETEIKLSNGKIFILPVKDKYLIVNLRSEKEKEIIRRKAIQLSSIV